MNGNSFVDQYTGVDKRNCDIFVSDGGYQYSVVH